jgi:enamine deaminase RidA (YjgF/YER057c/UK114 family)
MTIEFTNPGNWPRPSGYNNAASSDGRTIVCAGQIGWDENGTFQSADFVAQVEQALANIVAVLASAGAGPEHIARLTWFITDRMEYKRRLPEIGAAYRRQVGRHFPVMSVVEVSGLVEDEAKVEIEATAFIAA